MKKIGILLALFVFTISASAQEAKPAAKEKGHNESCCVKTASHEKAMTAAEVAQCKIKCKAEGKKCDATTAQAAGKKCDASMAKAEGKKCCSAKA